MDSSSIIQCLLYKITVAKMVVVCYSIVDELSSPLSNKGVFFTLGREKMNIKTLPIDEEVAISFGIYSGIVYAQIIEGLGQNAKFYQTTEGTISLYVFDVDKFLNEHRYLEKKEINASINHLDIIGLIKIYKIENSEYWCDLGDENA